MIFIYIFSHLNKFYVLRLNGRISLLFIEDFTNFAFLLQSNYEVFVSLISEVVVMVL